MRSHPSPLVEFTMSVTTLTSYDLFQMVLAGKLSATQYIFLLHGDYTEVIDIVA